MDINTSQQASEQKITDIEILRQAKNDPKVFEILVDRYEEAFLRKANQVLRDDFLAEDATQEAFVKIYLASERYCQVEGARPSSWMYKILLNVCYSLYMKQKKELTHKLSLDDEAVLLKEFLPDQNATLAHERFLNTDEVLSLISRLPLLLRKMLKKVFVDGASYAEIAKEEGVSEQVIRTRVHRAKKILKNDWQKVFL